MFLCLGSYNIVTYYCLLPLFPVYNLALSSKHFFGDIPASDEIERGAICQVHGLQSGKRYEDINIIPSYMLTFIFFN